VRRYLAIPGALLLIAAFIRAAANVRWDRTGVLLAAAGTVIVLITMIWNRREVIEWFRDPRGVFAVTTGISVAAFIAALVLLNISVWYHPWSVDLTASGRNEVSEETRRILQRLDQPVVLRRFGRGADPAAERLMRGFERETRRIRVELVDVDRDRQQATRYGVVKIGTIVAIAGDKFRRVEDANEQALVTAVLQVTADRVRVVCFVTGHGERGLADSGPRGLAVLASTLEASNYRIQPISLLEDAVPSDCSSMVIAGPRRAFAPEETARLDAYYSAQGRIAMLLEPDPDPSMGEWLHPRGVDPGPGAVIDTSGAGQNVGGGPRTPLAMRYLDHPVTRGFEIATMYDGARPLQVIERPEFGGRPVALAQTLPRSFSTTSGDPVPAFEQGRDSPGPLTLAAAIAAGGGGGEDQETRLAVFGDADFVSNALLGRQGNRDFFLRTLAWLMGEQEATVVSVGSRENRRIELTEGARTWMYIINVGLLPLLPLLAGIVVYLRNRHS
jgi:ABC-type uncharacterized transport system involved in gliding motility auxiliary subunit